MDPDQKTAGTHGDRRLSLGLASVFIVGEVAGSGVLALPKAVADAGWSGIALIVLCCGFCLYCSVCLGRCWSILEERYAEYRIKNRYPYPAIAEKAFGKRTRYFTSFCIDLNLFGVGVVFLLLCSQLVGSVAAVWGISSCYWTLILAGVLIPLMWLGTPEDFWPAAVIALATTATAVVLLVVLIAMESVESRSTKHSPPSVNSFFLAYGNILFAFGGAASFPTFQNDMRDRTQFTKAATLGFTALLLMFLPVAVFGYIVNGDDLPTNILNVFPDSIIKTIISVMLAVHVFFAFLLVINVPAQDAEEMLQVPRAFGYKRCVVRATLMIAAVFVAESIPRFGKVLNLVGGSVTALTSTVLPCLFYMKLCSQSNPEWPDRTIPLHEKVLLLECITCGLIGAVMATFSAVEDIVKPGSFSVPCYLNTTSTRL